MKGVGTGRYRLQARVLESAQGLQAESALPIFSYRMTSVVENNSDRVALVIISGQHREMGTRDTDFHPNPQHALHSPADRCGAHSRPDTQGEPRISRMAGEVPSPVYARGDGPVRQNHSSNVWRWPLGCRPA